MGHDRICSLRGVMAKEGSRGPGHWALGAFGTIDGEAYEAAAAAA